MTFQGDPYRTLGVAPGASLNEIKSAYRRLVKQYHPDAAGERALPRFLAIQAAYERLVDGEGRLRPASGSVRGSAARPQEAWRADPSRAGASRDAWRARRASRGSPGSGRPSSTTGGPADGFGWARPGAGSRRAPDDGQGGPAKRERPQREHHARRGPRKATPGSTTYDEAAELPLDPEWDGGAWYGPSSGTYWTLNPREYADPRKHGPEYLARARRAAGRPPEPAESPAAAGDGPDGWGAGRADASGPIDIDDGGVGPGPSPDTQAAGGPAGDTPRWRWGASPSSTTEGGTDWGTRAWRYDDAPPVTYPGDHRPRGASEAHAGRPQAAVEDRPLPDLESIARRFAPRHLLALARGSDRRWRLLLAFTGWPPIGFAVGSLVSTLTGCASFSPSCAEPLPLLPVLLQPLVIGALALVPPAAAVAAFAGIVALAAALPVAAVLAVGSLPESRAGAPVLGVVVAAAYFAGLGFGASAVWRTPGRGAPGGGALGNGPPGGGPRNGGPPDGAGAGPPGS